MSKAQVKDIIAVLRLYKVGNENIVAKEINAVKAVQPDAHSIIISFAYKQNPYLLIFNNDIDDDKDVIFNYLPTHFQTEEASLIESPLEPGTHSMPFKGKTIYLMVLKPVTQRLDVYLSNNFPEFTRSIIQKYIKSGFVLVNGEVSDSSSKLIKQIDVVTLNSPDIESHTEKTLPIIYKDKHVIVINKPDGVLSHSKGALSTEFTVADFFKRYSSYNATTNRPGVIHRLDRDTSGVMLGALDSETAVYLQKQFSNRTVKKTYYAVVKGQPKLDKAVIDLPIGRNPKKPSQFKIDAKGKTAQTLYEVVDSNGQYSLVKLEPKTGRTHQLRVHLAHIGNPIIGDKVYGTPDERLYLHAAKLELSLPDGTRKTFEAPVPKVFLKLVD